MELLSYPSLDSTSERQVQNFLNDVAVIGLTQDIEARAIELRRQLNLKLPDAIIAATTFVFDAELLTNDKKFQRVNGLQNPRARNENLDKRHLSCKMFLIAVLDRATQQG
jgi:predicted nucleic acid-binding protein